MEKISAIVTMFVVTAFAGTAVAADVIESPTLIGKVTFNHKIHKEQLKDCGKCHGAGTPGKIAGIGKEWAHKTCKGCHVELKKGPALCKNCHIK